MMLESIINKTISFYRENRIGIFHKKDLAIVFSKIKDENGKLKVDNGFVKNKSTADYYGVYKGCFVAFEAKSTQLENLPMPNIKKHQINYLREISECGGIGFIIIMFATSNEFYVLDIEKVDENAKNISKKELEKNGIKLELTYPGIIDFAGAIAKLKK